MSIAAIVWLGTIVARCSRRNLILVGATIFAIGQIGVLALAAESRRVSQKGRAFQVKALTIAAGDVVQFGNDDEFIHQIYVQSPNFNFDSAESLPGDTIDLKFTTKGTFEVHCHIHPKMLLAVEVQ